MLVISLLIPPVPPILIDLLAGASLTAAVLILMTSLLIKKPLEFTAFPTVLLVTTLYRLGLNLASTRLILAHGHEGGEPAGKIIQAFGQLMMSGSFVIGVIVFIILVIVNFVVITKGSTRIAEVAARFALDSMPGKQMAIDADLSSGLIDETEAKLRRKEVEQESTFFGAMDGASKFVRGDAVAGLIITAINIIGGILIGVLPAQGHPGRRRLQLHRADHRRRPGQPDPGPGHLDRRRLPGLQGGRRGLGRQGAGRPAGRQPDLARAWSRPPPASSAWCRACRSCPSPPSAWPPASWPGGVAQPGPGPRRRRRRQTGETGTRSRSPRPWPSTT